MCAIIIFYYQLDCVEGMAQWTENAILMDTYPKNSTFPKQYVRKNSDISPPIQVNDKPSATSVQLEYENNKIADYVNVKRIGNGKVNMVDQITMEEQLAYPTR